MEKTTRLLLWHLTTVGPTAQLLLQWLAIVVNGYLKLPYLCWLFTESLPPAPSLPFYAECPGRLKITSVTPYGSAIGVTWALKASASSYSIQSPLSITVLDIQIDGKGQQMQFNYSATTVDDGTECLGGLDPSTVYKVCLHPTYSDGLTEIVPVCENVTTTVSNENDFNGDECITPIYMFRQGNGQIVSVRVCIYVSIG